MAPPAKHWETPSFLQARGSTACPRRILYPVRRADRFPHDRSFVSGLVRSRRRREWRHRLVIRRTWRGARRSPDGDLATPLGYRLGLGPIHPSQVSTISGSGRCSTQRRSRCRDLQTSSRANGRLGTMITIGQAGFGRTNPSPASLQRSAEPPAYSTPSKSNPGQREDGKTRVNTELNGPLPCL